ncbi:hypothetical protein HDV00_002056 [Rhizophlyctis rosea]|nr:hypothetical protein HDV00_002056 [Rhizophlyctis rosea]
MDLLNHVIPLKATNHTNQRVSWVELSRKFNRSPLSLRDRWRVLEPGKRGDKFTPEEDALIRAEGIRALKEERLPDWMGLELKREMEEAVFQEGEQARREERRPNWADVARQIGSTEPIVFGKWRNQLDPNLKKGGWEQEELVNLEEWRKQGLGWAAIGRKLRRSPAVVYGRYQMLSKASNPTHPNG